MQETMSVKNRYHRHTLWMLAALLAACSTETVEPEAGLQQVPVVFTTGMQGSLTRSQQTYDVSRWTQGDAIAVSVASANSPKQYTADASSSADGGTTTFSPADAANTIYWPADKRDMHYDAWYPWSASRPTSATVPATQTATGDYDLLYAPGESHAFVQGTGQYPDLQAVPLVFYHQMVRLIINITIKTDDTWGSLTIGDGTNIGRTRAITRLGTTGETATDATATTWGTLSDLSAVTPWLRSSDHTNKVYQYECILPPQSGTNANDLMTIVTKISGSNNRTYHYKAAYDFKAGYQYTYSFELSIQGVTMTAAIQPWQDQTEKNYTSTPLLM